MTAREENVYFYREGRTIIDALRFRFVFVQLEDPFPEDEPEKPEIPPSVQPESHLKPHWKN